VTGAVFQLERSNSPAPSPADPTLTILTGKSRTQGAELQVTGNITRDWHANIGYTYLDGEIRSQVGGTPAGTRLAQLPEHQVAAWTRYDVTERFALGAGLIHSSEQFASLSNAVTLPAYTRVDLGAYFDISDNLSLQANIENLFDEDYYPSAHGDNNIQPARPLNATFTIRAEF
jgi:catecholate siderophore receptor